MATADELLRSAVVQPDPEGHIVVGGDRFITVPSNLKRLGVQYDHDMETVVFDCPRYWDKRDMSQMAVYINYSLSDGYMDRYPADNVTADGDIMHFEWTISRNVTQVAGTVAFLVCVMKTDGEGNEERHWNSELCTECYISAGMETEESPVDTHPDIITQLLLRMASVEQINVQSTWLTNISLPASAWVGEGSLYSQVVTIIGITERSKVDLLPSVEQLAIFHDKDVAFVTENEDGVVTVYAIGDKPTQNYTMQAQITEVLV